MAEYKIIVNSIDELPEAANKLLASLGSKRLLAFYGEMGVGKTTFIKAICAEMGVVDIVNSPTFSIVNQYEAKNSSIIFHFDFYRLDSYQEALDIGIFDYWDSDALCLMEWPEKIEKLLPEDCVYLELTEDEISGARSIRWEVI